MYILCSPDIWFEQPNCKFHYKMHQVVEFPCLKLFTEPCNFISCKLLTLVNSSQHRAQNPAFMRLHEILCFRPREAE